MKGCMDEKMERLYQHLFDHVQLPLFHLHPLCNEGPGDDSLSAAATAEQFRLGQRIFGPAMLPDVR